MLFAGKNRRNGWVLVACACLLYSTLGSPVLAASWSYKGNTGPDRWGALSPEFAACQYGRRQSPIDIETAQVEFAPLPPIELYYNEAPLRIVNNGHTIQVTYEPGSELHVGDRRYELRQLHFHAPSEEAIDGRRFPLVVHLVHADKAGNLAVIAVLFDVDETRSNAANEGLAPIWAHLPEAPGAEQAIPGETVHAAHLLPEERSYYFFEGSLTTPPCTEGVSWFVLRAPARISQEQLVEFTRIYPDNARPLQPVHGRIVQASP